MPTNAVHGAREEGLWSRAKAQAARQGKPKNYAYIMSIYQNMKGGKRRVEKAGQGEGSRGGHVIGHTSSGKPIYSASEYRQKQLPSNPQMVDYHSKLADQAKLQGDSAVETHHRKRAEHYRMVKTEKSEGSMDKAGTGEGSRGGVVIGHTGSGKPIYRHTPNVDTTSAGGIHGRNFRGWSAEDHHDAVLAHLKAADKIKAEGGRVTRHQEFGEHLHNADASWYWAKQLGKPLPKGATVASLEAMKVSKAGSYIEMEKGNVKALAHKVVHTGMKVNDAMAQLESDDDKAALLRTMRTLKAEKAMQPPQAGQPMGSPGQVPGKPPMPGQPAPTLMKPGQPPQAGAPLRANPPGHPQAGQPVDQAMQQGQPEGTHDYHKDKALAHLQAAQAHAGAAHSAKRVEEAKEHGQAMQAADQASQATMDKDDQAAMQVGHAANAGAVQPGQPGAVPPAAVPAGPPRPPVPGQAPMAARPPVPGQPPAPVAPPPQGAMPPAGPAQPQAGAAPAKPPAKPPFQVQKAEMHKSMIGMRGDVHEWLEQFEGSPLEQDALLCVKESILLSREMSAYFKEQDDRQAGFKAIDTKRAALDKRKEDLELRLIDAKLAAREPVAKSVLHKNNMEIDMTAEDQVLELIASGRTAIGAAGDALRQDGRARLLGMRGERMEKSTLSGGTVYQGEFDGQGSRGGDLRETVARAQQLEEMVELDGAGNRGQGGLAQWFEDGWNPAEAGQRVPANMGPNAQGWQKSAPADTIIVLDDSTPYGRANYSGHPAEHQSAVREAYQRRE